MASNPHETASLAAVAKSSISCATFLGRVGYTDITVFEKNGYIGGLSASEIPGFRLPYSAVNAEVDFMKDLGVKVVLNKALGEDFTVESLRADGYKGIFVGFRLQVKVIA